MHDADEVRRLAAERLRRVVARGAEAYERSRILPRLLPLDPREFAEPSPALTRRICAALARALRRERTRGRAGHWTYDLDRHLALLQAYRAERARLTREVGGRSSDPETTKGAADGHALRMFD